MNSNIALDNNNDLIDNNILVNNPGPYKGPYINTKLFTTVSLQPSQMDNKIYLNLKKNLEHSVKQKCYRDYGFIMDIYDITNYKNGVILAENLMTAALFDVSFSCRLCLPMKGMQIICQIYKVNKLLLTAVNGPIFVIVTKERINNKVFFNDSNNNFRFKTPDNKHHKLDSKQFVKLTIDTITFENGDKKIKVIGFLEDMATDKEIENFYKELYNKDDELVDFNEYAKLNDNTIFSNT